MNAINEHKKQSNGAVSTNEKYRNLLNAWFTGDEACYLHELLQDKENKRKFAKLLKENERVLYNTAVRILNKIEHGEIKPENLENAERKICLFLGALAEGEYCKAEVADSVDGEL